MQCVFLRGHESQMATHKTLSLQHHLKSLSEAKLPGESSKSRRCVLECSRRRFVTSCFVGMVFWDVFFVTVWIKVATATTFWPEHIAKWHACLSLVCAWKTAKTGGVSSLESKTHLIQFVFQTQKVVVATTSKFSQSPMCHFPVYLWRHKLFFISWKLNPPCCTRGTFARTRPEIRRSICRALLK